MANLSSKTGTVTTPVQAQISLANNSATSVQDMSAYQAQEVTGFVYVDASSDLRCSFKVMVVKNGADVFEIAAVDLAGDDYSGAPLLSFSMSGSVLRATLPNISGFVSAYLRYQLSAPYLGGNYPLSVDGSQVVSGTVAAARLPQVSSSSQGAFPSLVTSLDNATATQLGLKQYYHGTTYNAGLAPTVTCSAAGFAVRRAVFIPYQTQDGQWRLRFNIQAAFNSVTTTIVSLFVNGVVFKNINSQNEAMACCGFWGGLDSPIPRVYAFNSSNSSNEIAWRSTSAAGAIGVYGSGDVELESKPTWAY